MKNTYFLIVYMLAVMCTLSREETCYDVQLVMNDSYCAQNKDVLPQQPALVFPLGPGLIALDVRSLLSLKEMCAHLFGIETKRERHARETFVDTYKHWSTNQFLDLLAAITEKDFFGNYKNPKKFFEQYQFYQFGAFRSLIAEISGCYNHVCRIQQRLKNDKEFANFINTLPGLKSGEFQKILDSFANSLRVDFDRTVLQQQRERQEEIAQEKKVKQEQEYRQKILQNMEHDQVVDASLHSRSFYIRKQDSKQHDHKMLVWSEQIYNLSADAQNMLIQKNYAHEDYTKVYGMQMQHAAHKECIAALEQSAFLQKTRCKKTAYCVIDFVEAGRAFTKEGYIQSAYRCLDVCWTILDCCAAVSEGLADAAHNIVSSFVHPITTAQNLAQSIRMAGYCLGRYALFMGRVFTHTNQDAVVKTCDDLNIFSSQLVNYIKENPHEAIRNGTAFVAEIVLLHKSTRALHSFMQHVAEQAPKYAQIIQRTSAPLSPQAIGHSTIAVAIATEASTVIGYVKEAIKMGGTVTEAIAKVGPYITFIQHLPELEKIYKNSVKGFNGFEDIYVEWDGGIRHIYEPEVKQHRNGKKPKVDGFHHDWYNQLENSGQVKLTDKVIYEEGFYKADVHFNGAFSEKKTFFPANWSRERVLQTIMKFYENNKGLAIQQGSYWKIESYFLPKIKIRIIVDNNMRLITAYPVFE